MPREADIVRFEDKLDKVVDDIGAIKVTLAGQSIVLNEHIRRTGALEALVDKERANTHRVEGILKFLGALVALAGLVEGVTVLLEFLKRS